MRRRSLLAVLLGVVSASACLVPTFDVGPLPDAKGGTGGGGASGGKTTAEAGHAGNTTTGGGSSKAGGASTGGTSTGGTDQVVSGAAGEAGANGAAGASGAAGAGSGNDGPHRIGFSEFHDSASGGDEASASSPDAIFSKPAGTAAGDFMLVFFGCDHSLQNLTTSHLALTGWKLYYQHADYGTDGQATYLAYKFAGQSEPDSIVFTGINNAGGGNGVQGLLSVYRGVNPTTPINAFETVLVNTGSNASMHVETATPAVTSTVDNCLFIAGLSPDTAVDAPTVSSWPAGFDQNHVTVINPVNPNPNGWANIYSAEHAQANAGTVPASAFGWDITYGGSDYYGALTFVLALAP